MAALAVLAACATGDGGGSLAGEEVEVLAVWEDAEAAAFGRVLDVFEARTGACVRYTTTGGRDTAAVLEERLAAGDPPDVALLPQPALLRDLARRGALAPVGDIVGEAVRARYAPEWRRLGTVDGELYGVWFKAANKSLVWYSIGAFERAGVVPPSDLDGLRSVAAAVTAAGTPAFAVTSDPGDAWTITDLFENLYLRTAGPSSYDGLAAHRIPWTHPSVEEALRLLVELAAPPQRAPLPPGTTFTDAVLAVFRPDPVAAMIVEGDFVLGVVADRAEVEVGVHVDVFPFPEAGRDPVVVGGGDAAVLLEDSEPARQLLAFLATPEAAEAWARQGGFLSPNEQVDLAVYPDAATRRAARALLDAGGGGFRFDLSDLQPPSFGSAAGRGLRGLLQDLVEGRADVATTMARLEAAADEAWAASSPR